MQITTSHTPQSVTAAAGRHRVRAAVLAGFAALSVGGVGVLTTPVAAQAAPTSRAVIGSASTTKAVDVWSKGTITTPKVAAQGKAKVVSKTFRISKSGKTVVKTSTAGKRYSLRFGTYSVTSSAKYAVGNSIKKVTRTQRVVIGNSAKMTKREYNGIKKGMTVAKVASLVGGRGSVEMDFTILGDRYVSREWNNTHAYGVASVSFVNGKADGDKFWF